VRGKNFSQILGFFGGVFLQVFGNKAKKRWFFSGLIRISRAKPSVKIAQTL
jgi:hypothetical protein